MTNSRWEFPIRKWLGEIPVGPDHPGAFGAVRKHDIHTGVDLYVKEHEKVYAVEDGQVVAVENFTGPAAGSPWWLPTKAVLIEGKTGVVCYGEIEPSFLAKKLGRSIRQGDLIGTVIPVLKEPPKQEIVNHSRHMLHFELYKHGARNSVWWYHGNEKPELLLDPTEFLLESKSYGQ